MVDANERQLHAMSSAGKALGAVDLHELLGLTSMWPQDLAVHDGRAYLAVVVDNPDGGDLDIGLIFELRG